MPWSPVRRCRAAWLAVTVTAVAVLSACSGWWDADTVVPATAATPTKPVTLAFAGDVHFEGSAVAALDGGLGTAATALRSADLAVLNLETAVTSGGDRQPKQYAFRAPATAFTALHDAGVDAVSMANNHGMDYGRAGLEDSLAAASAAKVTVLGAGRTDAEAFAPLRRTVHGVKVAVFAATDVLDSFATTTWPATPDRAGLATTKDDALTRLADAVRAEKQRSDVVVALLHWGVEQRVCPTPRQQEVATALAQAGADAVVGSHAHVLQPTTRIGSTVVAYGLGNFVFYAKSRPARTTGVLTLTVDGTGVRGTAWRPALIRSGRPALLTGADRNAADAAYRDLGSAC